MCMQTWIDGRKHFDRDEDLKRRRVGCKAASRTRAEDLDVRGENYQQSQAEKDPSTWWVRYDEFCNHGHHHDEEAMHEHHSEHEESK